MAGMLPGVESARRRRFRQGGSSVSSASGSRRSSFCLYSTGLEPHLSSNSAQRSFLSKGYHGGELGDVAREAKERLDERLKNQRATEMKRHNSMGSGGGGDGIGPAIIGNVQRVVFSSKKGIGKFSWSKLSWKASEDQVECAVCLEEFKRGDILVYLPCAHRFHWSCVVPWLENSSHCPCCRTIITT